MANKGSSCLPCRLYKRKCDHSLPCAPCVRTGREALCRKNPSPIAILKRSGPPPKIFPKQVRPASKPVPILKPTLVPEPTTHAKSTLFEEQIYNSVRYLPLSMLTKRVDSNGRGSHTLRLVRFLPQKHQADVFVDNYFKLFAHMYCTVTPVWFYKSYDRLWTCALEELDIRVLGLLYAVMSVTCLELIPEKCSAIGMDLGAVRKLSDEYAKCSMDTLAVSEEEHNADIISIMTISVLQSYFHSCKDPNALNHYLAKSLTMAFELKLNEEYTGPSAFQREVRHRLWWDIVLCDNYQTFCLNRAPIIPFDRFQVPFPVNCNDQDLEDDQVPDRPITDYTHTSYMIHSLKLFRIFSGLRDASGELTKEAERVVAIDRKICDFIDSLPWYFRLTSDKKIPATNGYYDHPYLFHMFWTCLQTQRFRMHRSYLYPRVDYCYKVCLEASSNVLDVYAALRSIYTSEKKDGLVIQGHNLFSASLAQLVFMLVENPPNSQQIMRDAEMVINDLEFFTTQGVCTKIVKEGCIILKELLGLSNYMDTSTGVETHYITKRIGYIFGGESAAEMYLHRLSIGYIVSEDTPKNWSSTRFENTAGEEFFTKEPWDSWDLGDWSKFFQ